MNTKLLIIIISCALLFTSCAKSIHANLVGEWKGTNSSGSTMSLLFESDSTAKIVDKSIVVTGDNVRWSANDDIEPFQLDIIISNRNGRTFTIPAIYRFITEDKIQIRMSDDIRSRPIDFSDIDQKAQVIMLRQK